MNVKYFISLAVFGILIFSCSMLDQELTKNLMEGKEKRQRLLREGEKCEAEVLKVEDTHITVNQDPVIKMKLEVMPPGQPSFDAEVETVVPRINIPRKGDNVTVYYNPKDKNDIIAE